MMGGTRRTAAAAAAVASRVVTDLSDAQPLVVGRAQRGVDDDLDHSPGLQQREVGGEYLRHTYGWACTSVSHA